MADRYDVQLTVTSVLKNPCPRGIKEGDTWIIENNKTPDGLCGDAYQSMAPSIRNFWLGGTHPWDKDPDITYRACPDPECLVIFEVKRLRK